MINKDLTAAAGDDNKYKPNENFYMDRLCPEDTNFHVIWNDDGNGNPGLLRLIDRAMAAGVILHIFKVDTDPTTF